MNEDELQALCIKVRRQSSYILVLTVCEVLLGLAVMLLATVVVL